MMLGLLVMLLHLHDNVCVCGFRRGCNHNKRAAQAFSPTCAPIVLPSIIPSYELVVRSLHTSSGMESCTFFPLLEKRK